MPVFIVACCWKQIYICQKLSVPGLVDMLDWTGKNIDSALKKQGYLLMHKEVDFRKLRYFNTPN